MRTNNGNMITKTNETVSCSHPYDNNNVAITATKKNVIQGKYYEYGEGNIAKACSDRHGCRAGSLAGTVQGFEQIHSVPRSRTTIDQFLLIRHSLLLPFSCGSKFR